MILKEKKHLYTRFPLLCLGIVLLAFSPLIIGIIGANITERWTGEACHEGNCTWMVLPWLSMLTIPIGGIVLLIFLVVGVRDILEIRRKKKDINLPGHHKKVIDN